MKSRWTTYLVLAVVIIVWGWVLWKIIGSTKNRSDSSTHDGQAYSNKQASVDTDPLRMDYPDPFLKKKILNSPQGSRPSIARPLPEVKRPVNSKKMQFVHLGRISVTGKQLHILTINGRQYEIQEGDSVDGFLFYKSDNDSLYLRKGEFIYGIKQCQ